MKTKILIPMLALALQTQAAEVKAEKEHKEVEVTINQDGDKITKKVIINGKELSPEEIEEFEASGQMKTLHLDHGGKDGKMHKVIVIGDDDKKHMDKQIKIIKKHVGEDGKVMEWVTDSDIEIEKVMSSGDDHDVKVFKKKIEIAGDEKPVLGFMVDAQDDGWHVLNVIDSSGAQEAGIQSGDIVISIAGKDMTGSKDNKHVKKSPEYQEGETVKVELLRDGKEMTVNVEAKKLDHNSILHNVMQGDSEHFKWIEKIDDDSFGKEVKVMVFSDDDNNFHFNDEDINIVFPDDLEKFEFFVSDGKSTSGLLGKHHEMSALSDDLGKYFHTSGGVLVIKADDDNVFGLKDGDVIKSVNGNDVSSPKDVVKQLVKADDQEKIKVKIVRNKKNKTLKYNK